MCIKPILCCLLICLAVTTYCQPTNPSRLQISDDYLKKSRRQKTAGLILLGVGAAALMASIPVMKSEYGRSIFSPGGYTGLAIGAGGTLVALSSIPFFITSSKNKNRAAAVSVFLRSEEAPVLQAAAGKSSQCLSITFRLQ